MVMFEDPKAVGLPPLCAKTCDAHSYRNARWFRELGRIHRDAVFE